MGRDPSLGRDTERVAEAYCATNEAAQNVASALIRRRRAPFVADDEDRSPEMIADDPQSTEQIRRGPDFSLGIFRLGDQRLDDGPEGTGLVNSLNAAEHRERPLKPHAGINIALW